MLERHKENIPGAVILTACHSENIGQAFIDAGVNYVVCCKREEELRDRLTIDSTKEIYTLLKYGNSFQEVSERIS